MEKMKLAASERGLLQNREFTGYTLFNHGQIGTKRPTSFGPVYVFNDDTLLPGSSLEMHPHKNVEIITIIVSGEESHQDTLGVHDNYCKGDIQLISAGSGLEHSGGNVSSTAIARHLQIWIAPRSYNTIPRVNVLRSLERTFDDKGLKIIVSPNGTDGSLEINQDVWIYELEVYKDESYFISSKNHHGGILAYIMEGDVAIADTRLEQGDSLFLTDWDYLEIQSKGLIASIIIIDTVIE